MLYLRYRRSPSDDRRRIRWLLAGMGSTVVVLAALFALASSLGPGLFGTVVISFLWALGLVLALGSLVVALSQDGVFGIDRSARRSMVYRSLWLLIAVVYVAAATALFAAQPVPVDG